MQNILYLLYLLNWISMTFQSPIENTSNPMYGIVIRRSVAEEVALQCLNYMWYDETTLQY